MKKLLVIISLVVMSVNLYAKNNYVYVRPVSGLVYYTCGNEDWDFIEEMYLWRNVISNKYVLTESSSVNPNDSGYYDVYVNEKDEVSGVSVKKYKYYSQKGWCIVLYYN